MQKNNKGFTLMEMLIVVAIIAVLVAIAIPFFGVQMKKVKQNQALADCRTCVNFAYILFLDDNTAPAISAVEEVTQVSGKISSMIFTDGELVKLRYISSHDIAVVYEEGVFSFIDGVEGCVNIAVELLNNNSSITGDNLYAAFLKKYGGTVPLTQFEKSLTTPSVADALVWKPNKLGTKEVMMIAIRPENKNLAYVIFYAGNYYYHTNPGGHPNNSWVIDNGTFNSLLLIDAPDSNAPLNERRNTWVKYAGHN